MKITNVRIHLRDEKHDSKLRAFVTITIDDVFVIRDLKIIEGKKGLFVAMPTAKIKKPCPKCGAQNFLRSQYCYRCGDKLNFEDQLRSENAEEYKEIAHPITSDTRNYIQETILDEYQKSLDEEKKSDSDVS